jgi:hypothetical protein
MSKFSFSFGKPTNKTVTGTAYVWGLLIANHQWVWLTKSEILSPSQVQFITLFIWRCRTVLRLSPALARCTNLVQKNQFPELNRHILTFSIINFTVWSHILSTSGDALSWKMSFQTSDKLINLKNLRFFFSNFLMLCHWLVSQEGF